PVVTAEVLILRADDRTAERRRQLVERLPLIVHCRQGRKTQQHLGRDGDRHEAKKEKQDHGNGEEDPKEDDCRPPKPGRPAGTAPRPHRHGKCPEPPKSTSACRPISSHIRNLFMPPAARKARRAGSATCGELSVNPPTGSAAATGRAAS